LLTDAAQLARNFDYMVECGHNSFCDHISFWFAYNLPRVCNENVHRFIERRYRSLPTPNCQAEIIRNCEFDVEDVENNSVCANITIEIIQ
jgi:hypothetical protein